MNPRSFVRCSAWVFWHGRQSSDHRMGGTSETENKDRSPKDCFFSPKRNGGQQSTKGQFFDRRLDLICVVIASPCRCDVHISLSLLFLVGHRLWKSGSLLNRTRLPKGTYFMGRTGTCCKSFLPKLCGSAPAHGAPAHRHDPFVSWKRPTWNPKPT